MKLKQNLENYYLGTINMNSQITATIWFSLTIFIKLQNITVALGNISANISPKILPLQVHQGLDRAPANFLLCQKYEMEGSKLAFAKSCILKVSRDFKTFLKSLARLARLSRLLLNKLFLVKLMTRGKGGGQKS